MIIKNKRKILKKKSDRVSIDLPFLKSIQLKISKIMSKKGSKVECPPFMYNIDFILKKYDVFANDNGDDLQTMIRFRMLPGVCLDIEEEDYINQVNCSKPVIKNCMFSLTDDQVTKDLQAMIIAYRVKCSNSMEMTNVGCYKIENLHCEFSNLRKDFMEKSKNLRDEYDLTKCPKFGTPTEKTISEISPLMNAKSGAKAGTLFYSLKITCFGPYKSQKNVSIADGYAGFLSELESEDMKKGESKKEQEGADYDEYMAQINGNSLIVRVPKNHPYLVTQVFDPSTTAKNDFLTIRGCDQQIDFQFPDNFTCCHCKQKFGKCNCNPNSALTDFQRKTSCAGNSYKNTETLPAIRGNLKYPGRFEDQSVRFNVRDREPTDATEKYRLKEPSSRNACMQIDSENLHRIKEGLCPIKQGISVCKKGCEDDSDIFKFKINRKRTAKSGKKNEIELELRTPRGPSLEIPKLETREIQVNENEFESITDGKSDAKGKGKTDSKSKPAASKAGKVQKKK